MVMLVNMIAFAGITPVLADENITSCTTKTTNTEEQQIESDRRVIESKLRLLRSITNNSPTAIRIEKSGDSEAIGLLQHARTFYEQARMLSDKGCLNEAEQQLNKGLRTVENASQKIVNSKRNNEIARQEYEHKLSMVNSYRETYNRIVAEKGSGNDEYLDKRKLDELVISAKKLMQQNDYELAHKEIEKAVYMLEAALTALRDRETLVDELKFESIEEEYAYEMETNNSYLKLLNMILNNNNSNPMRSKIEELVKHNDELKRNADAMIAEGDMKSALGFLEQGTENLILALRYTGIGL